MIPGSDCGSASYVICGRPERDQIEYGRRQIRYERRVGATHASMMGGKRLFFVNDYPRAGYPLIPIIPGFDTKMSSDEAITRCVVSALHAKRALGITDPMAVPADMQSGGGWGLSDQRIYRAIVRGALKYAKDSGRYNLPEIALVQGTYQSTTIEKATEMCRTLLDQLPWPHSGQ